MTDALDQKGFFVIRTILATLFAVFATSSIAYTTDKTTGATIPSISIPLADRAPGVKLAYSGSAFAVVYFGGAYVVTANHVLEQAGRTHEFLIHNGQKWAPIPNKWRTGPNDIAVTDVTHTGFMLDSAPLAVDTSGLVSRVTKLTVLCSPTSLTPVPVEGVYAGFEQITKDVSVPEVIAIKTDGAGLPHGCSGAAVIDEQRLIVGMLIAGSEPNAQGNMTIGYAVPASLIAQFLYDKYPQHR